MKVVLINPGPMRPILGSFSRAAEPFAPLGLAYLAGVLKRAGHDVRVIDQFAQGISDEVLLNNLKKFSPDLVGISCLTPDTPKVEIISSLIREKLPTVKIALGNLQASLFAYHFLKKGFADYVVHGEAEVTLVKLISKLEKSEPLDDLNGVSWLENSELKGVKQPSLPDLNQLPFPAWELFPIQLYQTPPLFKSRSILLPISASRGCPFSCYFCCQNYLIPSIRKRNIELVVNEVERNLTDFGVRTMWFSDAIFPLDDEQGMSFTELMIKRGLNKRIRWITETRTDMVSERLLKELKNAGLMMVIYGFEVGEQKVLSRIKPGATIEDSIKAMKATKKAGLTSLGLFMLGFPWETEKECRRTIEFAIELDPDYAKFNRAVPYPGSRFFEEVKPKIQTSMNFLNYNPWLNREDDVCFIPPNISPEKMIKLQRKAMRRFYLRPSKALRLVLSGKISLRNLARGASAILGGLLTRYKSS